MRSLKKIKEYKNSYARKTVVETKDWFLFRWEVVVIIALALFAALLNQIPNWVVKEFNGKIDSIHSYPLRNNIYYSSFSIFITIGISIFIGVFTELGKFAGKYGSAIFVLVPSFVWLLSDRTDNHIENILNTAKFLGTIIFWTIMGIGILFVIMTAVKQVLATFVGAYKSKLRIEFIYNYINRFNIVIINVLIVLMLGYAFINYGIFSLHLANNSPADMAADPNLGPYNLHSESFTIYIALVAVLFALLMVIISLTHILISKPEKELYVPKTSIYLCKDEDNYKKRSIVLNDDCKDEEKDYEKEDDLEEEEW